MRKQAVFRIRVLTGAILLVSLILVVRLYQIQVHDRTDYQSRGQKQYVHTVEDIYNRGSIFFTTRDDEKIAAATIQHGSVLAVNPTQINDPEKIYAVLSEFIDIDKDIFIHRATLPGRTFVEIDSQVDSDAAEKIKRLDLDGVQLYKNQWRYYPGKTLAARTVGFVGYTGEEKEEKPSGRYGLERYYEDVLTRENENLYVNFFAEIFSNLGSIIFDNKDSRQGDVVTTLEPTVSRLLQNELLKTNEEWNSSLTGGIIMNPKNGAIYALDAVPTFDLNNRSSSSISDFRNPLVENVYEFGSIIKALTMAAGLDSRAVSESTTYYDAGQLELDTFTIRNYDGRGRGTVDMQEVLNQSLNTGVSFVVSTMGKELFRDYFMKLRLGSETGIDLPNETHGLVDNLNSPRDVEYATASFGQGIAMTPIETVRALSALGNGGHLVTPHLVSDISYLNGHEKEVLYPEGEQVFSEETSERISRMLVTVVDDALRGGTAALPNYSVAAKTGTAQIADHVNGGYYDDRYLHSFFGYFPAYDPEFLVFLYTVEPKEVRYASETLTTPFMDIVKFLINYYDVPPDREVSL